MSEERSGSQFKREPRYVVFKINDIEQYLTQCEKESLLSIGDEIACAREDDGKPSFNAVVVEEDWPEFEPTWAAIEARMTDEPKHDWVVHLTGPDDVFPQPDELTALREANALNKVIASRERHEYDPICVALVKDQTVEAV